MPSNRTEKINAEYTQPLLGIGKKATPERRGLLAGVDIYIMYMSDEGLPSE